MTTLTNSLGLSSLYAVVAAHFDLFFFFFFGSCSFLFSGVQPALQREFSLDVPN